VLFVPFCALFVALFESAVERFTQAFAIVSACIADPVTDDAAVAIDYESLRDCALAVHQRARELTIGKAEQKAEIGLPNELVYAI